MRRSFGFGLVGLLCAVVLSGCAGVASPLYGGILTAVQYGDTVTTATDASKKGSSCAVSILGLIAMGDASVSKAKEKGGITEVSSVDHAATSFLGLFASWCTIVAGK